MFIHVSGVAVVACIIHSLSAQPLGETVYQKRCAACHEAQKPPHLLLVRHSSRCPRPGSFARSIPEP